MAGWIDRLISKKMHLNWSGSGSDRCIHPEWYFALEFNYKSHPMEDILAFTRESWRWLKEMNCLWKPLPLQSRYVSGARAISALLGEEIRQGTNTDIALLAQRPILEAYVEQARAHHFYLMRRTSWKTHIHSPIKYHVFYPVTIDQALGENQKFRRNIEFTRIDPAANMICPEFTPRNHIKLYLHKSGNTGHLVCTEDKQHIQYPAEYFRGVPVDILGSTLYVIDPRYMHLKLTSVVANKEKNYQKHVPDLERLTQFIEQNPERFPMN